LVQHEATLPPTRRVTLDIDSSESPVHGAQEQAVYNGHFESGYHPLFVFNQNGKLPRRQAPAGQRPQCRRVGQGSPPRH
jgi:hypothetical protein